VETQVRTPQMVFMQPQRLVVPLFQRPYVWNEENQWEPLWNDLVRVADRVLARPSDRRQAHFLGAVVLQQVQRQTGLMQERTIIDGQQRLTTLQLLLDALHAELLHAQAMQPAMRIEPLVTNAAPFCSRPEDRFKVWPTNRDRSAFNSVMGAEPPVDYGSIGHAGEKMVQAHRFFSDRAREWLSADDHDEATAKAAAIELSARELLQIVVIDLTVDENAQEIFETLNARGAQLTAADLIKNFIFQRLLEAGADVDGAYQQRWKDFETSFWEKEISVGRLRYARSALFLNHWLIARTGEEVLAREVFARFKRYADHDGGLPMAALLEQIHRAALVYRRFGEGAASVAGPVDRLGLFGYRTGVLESEVIKPLVLWLLDPELPGIPDLQIAKALESIESWMVRRMLVRATTKNYNQVVAELIRDLQAGDRGSSGDHIESFLSKQTSASRYWPDDQELIDELTPLPAYDRLGRGRLRMVLEAVEDHVRGWCSGRQGIGGERVARGEFAIEHVMPRKWHTHWPQDDGHDDADRDRINNTLGNLTLLTGRMNSRVSNGPWLGVSGKRQELERSDVLLLNRELIKRAGDRWTDEAVRNRTQEMIRRIIEIWPAPPGHKAGVARERPRLRRKILLSDLIAGGALEPGLQLYPQRKQFRHRVATLLADGSIEVDGEAFPRPSDAASAIVGKRMSGWWFFLTDVSSGRSLRDVRRDYVDSMAVDSQDDESDDDDGEA
jgi:hypothetical protein